MNINLVKLHKFQQNDSHCKVGFVHPKGQRGVRGTERSLYWRPVSNFGPVKFSLNSKRGLPSDLNNCKHN